MTPRKTDTASSCRRERKRHGTGFTLVELLVVVTVIVLLVGMLLPAMESAFESAKRARCLVNQRTIAMSMVTYAQDFQTRLPDYNASEANNRSSADLRSPWLGDGSAGDYARTPSGMGRLPAGRYLPASQLGAVLHCPSFDNMRSSGLGVGMDRPWRPPTPSGAGGSAWLDPAFNLKRIMASYHYRAASWSNVNQAAMKAADTGSLEVLLVDFADARYGGRYHHPGGYNRVFGDVSGAFFFDPKLEVERIILSYNPGGWFGGVGGVAANEEKLVYPYLATQK